MSAVPCEESLPRAPASKLQSERASNSGNQHIPERSTNLETSACPSTGRIAAPSATVLPGIVSALDLLSSTPVLARRSSSADSRSGLSEKVVIEEVSSLCTPQDKHPSIISSGKRLTVPECVHLSPVDSVRQTEGTLHSFSRGVSVTSLGPGKKYELRTINFLKLVDYLVVFRNCD
jgi:hypothetical protein